nr:PREDICTED: probable protein phosphatase 2C 75 [Daucus carota subsp. sativus]
MSENCDFPPHSNAFCQCPPDKDRASSEPRLLPLFPVEVPDAHHSGSTTSPLSLPQSPQETIPSQLLSPPIPREPFCGSVCLIGKSQHMEDAISIIPQILGSLIPSAPYHLHFYGVFDGHGGSLVSGFCQAQMHQMVLEVLLTRTSEIQGIATASVEWWDILMTRSFRNMDGLALRTCPCGALGVNCGNHSTQTQSQYSEFVGSTAAVVLLSDNQIIVANCGDSGVVLANNGNTVPLTHPHKPDRPDEWARIEELGGPISRSTDGRVRIDDHLLTTTRAIGNRHLKKYLIPDPDVTLRTRDSKDEFLIIASAGFWDVVSTHTACHVARGCFRHSHPPYYANADDANGEPHHFDTLVPSMSLMYPSPSATAAAILSRMAGIRGSEDNISVIVVDLMNNRS